jgi:hypothetical protein
VVHIATTVLLKGYYGIYRNERQILALKETWQCKYSNSEEYSLLGGKAM